MKCYKCAKTIAALCISVATATPAAVIEKPVVMKEALVTATISDLHGFINGVGSVAAQVNPMMNGMMLKSMMGMQLGDPNLAGIAPGKGMAIVAMDQTNVFAVVEVREAQQEAYVSAMRGNGLAAKYSDGLLVVAPNDEQVAKGVALAPAVQSQLLSKRSARARIALQPASLVGKYNDEMEQMFQLLTMQMAMAPMGMGEGSTNPARLLEGEMRLLISLASQCDATEYVIAPANGSLGISQTMEAKAGTRLAKLLNAPKINKPNPLIQCTLLEPAALEMDGMVANTEAMNAFIGEETEALAKEMGLKTEDMTKWTDLVKKWWGLYGGSFCETIDFGGDSFMNVSYVSEIKDEAATKAMLKSLETDVAPFMEIYNQMGVPMTFDFKEGVRDHQDVKINQFAISCTLPDAPADLPPSLNLSNMVFDVAVFDGKMLQAMGDTTIESLIDRVKAGEAVGAPLKARTDFPAGGTFYLDCDVAKYIKGLSSTMPQEAGMGVPPQILAALEGADPITSAAFAEGGAAMWSVHVPGSLIGKIGQAAMMMQMQQMQQGGMQTVPVQ